MLSNSVTAILSGFKSLNFKTAVTSWNSKKKGISCKILWK